MRDRMRRITIELAPDLVAKTGIGPDTAATRGQRSDRTGAGLIAAGSYKAGSSWWMVRASL